MFLDGIAYRILKSKDYSKLFLWLPKLLLQWMFLWPVTENYHVKSTVAMLLLIPFLLFPSVGIGLNLLSSKNLDEVAFSLTYFLACCQVILKIIILRYKSKPLRELVDNIMTKFWSYDLLGGDVQKEIKSFYSIAIAIILPLFPINLCITAAYIAPPLFMVENRTLVIPVKYPFDYTLSPTYEMVFASQVLASPVLICGAHGADLLFFGISASVVIQLKILQTCFLLYNTAEMVTANKKFDNNKLYTDDSDDDRQQFFVTCLKHHLFIVRLTKRINEVFSPIVLVQLCCSTFDLCTTILQLAQPSTTAVELFLGLINGVGVLNELFIYCIIGNQLQYEASLIPKFIYNSNWSELENKEIKKDFMMVLQYAQQDIQLSAYGLFDLNMASYLKVVRMSFSIYTFLSSMAT